jgi:hypothetical protein
MLTGAPGALVKELKEKKIYIEKNILFTFKKLTVHISIHSVADPEIFFSGG